MSDTPASQSARASGSSIPSKVKAPPRQIPPALRPLQYLGIPAGVLSWKPRLPSRNWSIFILTTSSLTYLWWEDRRQVNLLLEKYKDQVRWQAEQRLEPNEYTRRIKVYTGVFPGNDDYSETILFFKKYMKPIFAAAGLDWEIKKGTRYGGLAASLRDGIHERRRKLAGIIPWSDSPMIAPDGNGMGPFSLTAQQILERELDGGVVLVGRPAFKEYMWALREGWIQEIPQQPISADERLAAELANDGVFGRPSPASPENEEGEGSVAEDIPERTSWWNRLSKTAGPSSISPKSARTSSPSLPGFEQIPAQPPLCYVDYINLVGWRNIPRRMYRFFRRRDDVRMGGDAALRLVLGDKASAREFQVSDQPGGLDDREWGKEGERFWPADFSKTDEHVEKARTDYYKEMATRLEASREIASGEREMTKKEARDPPPSESDLKVERFEKERQWRERLEGFRILNRASPAVWHPAFAGSLRVFEDRFRAEEPRSS